jgi:DNA polymerase III epsilon subunit-like protein
MYLFFDTETTGLPVDFNAHYTDTDNWPRLVQLAYCLAEDDGEVIASNSWIIKPEGFTIPEESSRIHGITTARARKEGVPLIEVLQEFKDEVESASLLVAHNFSFDSNIIGCEYFRNVIDNPLIEIDDFCTMKDPDIIDFVAAQPMRYGRYKWPSLTELYNKCFGRNFDFAHDAAADMVALKECFFHMVEIGVIDIDEL